MVIFYNERRPLLGEEFEQMSMKTIIAIDEVEKNCV